MFASLGVTVWIARLLVLVFLGVLAAYGQVFYSNVEATGKVNLDAAYFVLLIPTALAAGFAWLGFSTKGRMLLADHEAVRIRSRGWARILKFLFASYGIAIGVWMILNVLATPYPNLVEQLYGPWPLIVFTALSFPIAYKWLK